ncbi:MAG TPA: HAMP domain-containing sensor histidine kinase [Puia sp.]|nr:HAMP domain-containing sensor histidine kinase [Puia sp.]
MAQKKMIPDPLLMLMSILGIAAFLTYWLHENYEREKRTLVLNAESNFRESIERLQVAKLDLKKIAPDLIYSKKANYFFKSDSMGKRIVVDLPPKKQIFSTIHIINSKLKDSLKKEPSGKKKILISINETNIRHGDDSDQFDPNVPASEQDHLIQLLYGIDSLQEPLQLKEIDSVYRENMQLQNLNIPFSILESGSTRLAGVLPPTPSSPTDEVTVGLARPVTYQLVLGNTIPYLLKRLDLPIIFSFLLLCITILAFVALYKNLAKQKVLSDHKNEFISNMTHELRTPVATVAVAIEALKNFNAIDDSQRAKEYLDISSNELQRLNLLVDKVLNLSRFENRDVEVKYETIDLRQIVDEVVESLRLQFEKQEAHVSVTSSGNLQLQGDRLNLQSVVFNLLDNALKYTIQKPVIEIDLAEKQTSVELKVTDNGIGIPPEYKEKVFEKFFRVPHGDKHNAKGYGLGLSYIAQVIQKHQGKILIGNKKGMGATFIIIIPKKLA